MNKLLIILFLLFPVLLIAQVEHSQSVNPYASTPRFYIDFANYESDTPGKTRVDVFINVPYSSIQFVRKDDGYLARYSITLTFYDEDKENIIFERVWSEKVLVDDFRQTTSSSSFNISYRSFDLVPDDYQIQCLVEDLDSRKTVTINTETVVLEFDDEVEISDIVLIADRVVDENGERIIPNVSRIVTNRDKGLSFFFEVYSDIPRTVFIEYKLEDKNRDKAFTQTLPREISKGKNVIYHSLEDPNFSLGDYNLVVTVKDEGGDELAAIGKKITSRIFGYPRSIKDLDNAVNQMMYIASSDELDYIKDAETYDEKLTRFMEYWKKKDPSPNTEENEVLEEYYRRINYSNEKFKSFYDGWRTDMGMIYTTLGPPDYVERYPFAEGSKPYEIWDFYDLNKRFVFVDETGFGDYRLLNPVYGDWYRYRY